MQALVTAGVLPKEKYDAAGKAAEEAGVKPDDVIPEAEGVKMLRDALNDAGVAAADQAGELAKAATYCWSQHGPQPGAATGGTATGGTATGGTAAATGGTAAATGAL